MNKGDKEENNTRLYHISPLALFKERHTRETQAIIRQNNTEMSRNINQHPPRLSRLSVMAVKLGDLKRGWVNR